jgi:mannose-1-phosphate guanylyltransferase
LTRTPPPRVHAVVLAGGAGERFWPASRSRHPKPLLEVIGGKSLLGVTMDRAKAVASEDCVWVVCGDEHAAAMRKESALPANRVLVEPMRRNTAMAVAWAALRIQAEDPDAVMCVLPADHHIPDRRAFAATIKKAARAARDAQVLVTIGVQPTRPDTGYGYIQVGAPAGRGFAGLRKVRRFVEKPDSVGARRYLRQGGYLWNAGIFIWSVRALLEEIEGCAPKLHRALAPLRDGARSKAALRKRKNVEAVYSRAPSVPIDVAVMEVSKRVWTVPATFAWSDVGTWDSLADELGVGGSDGGEAAHSRYATDPDRGNRIIAGDVLLQDATGNLIWGSDRLIALSGVDGLAVVDTDDVILITKLNHGSDVRQLVARLKSRGRSALT